MEEDKIITCPYCRSGNIREIPHKVGHRAILADDLPKDEEVPFYRCMKCGREFEENELEG